MGKRDKRYLEDYLYKHIQSYEEARAYLIAALNDSDTFITLKCIESIINSRGGIAPLAKKIECSAEDIRSCLSQEYCLPVDILNKIFSEYGLNVYLYSIDDVADYFIWSAQEKEAMITHLYVQKLCYLAEAFYLVIEGVPLTAELFQAWEYGPVSYTLWKRFKNSKGKDLRGKVKKKPDISENVKEHLETVIYQFCKKNPWELAELTHDTPWGKTPRNKNIEKEDIICLYKKYAKLWNRKKHIFP